MVPGIDPKVDYAFKRLFGVERNRHILIDLIEAVLQPSPDRRIAEIELLNPFSEKEALDDRLAILDVKARDQSGRQFNLEMQMLFTSTFCDRILYYWAKIHQGQLHQGDDYHVLRPTISICFLDANPFPDVRDYRLQFELMDRNHGTVLSSHLAIHLIPLPKFDRAAEAVQSRLEMWLYFLRHGSELDTDSLPARLDDSAIHHCLKELTMLSQTELERERYESRLMAIRDEQTRLRDVREEGREEGRKEGRGQGELVGRIQFIESMLGRPETSSGELYGLPLAELQKRADELEREFHQRNNGSDQQN